MPTVTNDDVKAWLDRVDGRYVTPRDLASDFGIRVKRARRFLTAFAESGDLHKEDANTYTLPAKPGITDMPDPDSDPDDPADVPMSGGDKITNYATPVRSVYGEVTEVDLRGALIEAMTWFPNDFDYQALIKAVEGGLADPSLKDGYDRARTFLIGGRGVSDCKRVMGKPIAELERAGVIERVENSPLNRVKAQKCWRYKGLYDEHGNPKL